MIKKNININLNNKIKKILNTNDDNYEIIDPSFIKKYELGTYANKYNFYILPGLKQKINKNLKLVSQIEITYNDFINILFDITEDVYIIGGFVRNSFLNLDVNDLDLSFTSNTNNITELCKKHKFDCSKSVPEHSYQVFSDNIEGFYNNSIFKQGQLKIDYTINSLIYDIKSDVLITHTPYTLNDLVNRIIRIPVPPKLYDKWNTKWDKPLRYFKLILINLKPYDKQTENYIVNYINSNIDTVYLIKLKNIERIKKFIIVNISLGKVFDDGTFQYGPHKKRVFEYLTILKKYLNNDVFFKIIILFTKDLNGNNTKKDVPTYIYNDNKINVPDNICHIQKKEYNKAQGGGTIYTIILHDKKYILKIIPIKSKKESGFIRYNKEYSNVLQIYKKIDTNDRILFAHIYAIYKCNDNENIYLMDYYEHKITDFINNIVVFRSLIIQTLIGFYILNNIVELYHNDIVEQVTKKIPLEDTEYLLKNILVTKTDIKEYYQNDIGIKVEINDYLFKIIDFATLKEIPTMFTMKLSNIYFPSMPYVSEVVLSLFILLSYIIPKKNVAKLLNNIIKKIFASNKYIIRKEFDKQFIIIINNALLKNMK